MPCAQPLALYREALEGRGVHSCRALQECRDGEQVALAGLVLRPHRPPTPSGLTFVFFSMEDETGLV